MIRRRSTASSVVSVPTPLRHPTPDLHSLQGAYTKNVAKLERSAEEMSQGGSDIGEEIRKMNEFSRQNSIQNSQNGEISVVRPSVVERMGSNRSTRSGSYGRNIVTDVNGAARWGGYSPGGYVMTSPISMASPTRSRSGSWSQASLSGVASGSRSSRLAQVRSISDDEPLGLALKRASSSMFEQIEQLQEQEMEHSRDPSQSSFARHYDEIAGEIEHSLEHIPPSLEKQTSELYHNEALQHLENGGEGTVTPPDRPRSTDTYREAQTAFQDFDGSHFPPETDEIVEIDEYGNEIRRVSARNSTGRLSIEAASLLRTPRARPVSGAGVPPPSEGMVYYPAPVPKILNLPKRLSQLPSAAVQSKRKSQMINDLPADARAGAPWLSQENVIVKDTDGVRDRTSGHHSRGSGSSGAWQKSFFNERMSANVSNLPPQLRAEMFFEHQPVQHDVEVKSESAVATLDSILAASATAPVHAFTDHPFAGDVRKSVYAPEKTHKPRRSTATISAESTPEKKVKKRRSSSIGQLLKRTTSSDEVSSMLKKRGSRASVLTDMQFNEGGNKLRKRKSQLSVGDELERDTSFVQTPADEIDEPNLQTGLVGAAQNATLRDDDHRVSRAPTAMSSGYRLDDDGEQVEDDFKEEEAQEDVEEGEPLFVKPSTLLAELQVRKAQQKSRGKTAATAFPQGMHSTLLQLDAVEEISKRKRKEQRIKLAWEDPHQRALETDTDKNDEDVPLGMLFPGKDGANSRAKTMGDGKDFARPLGLMERRQLEDNEPLSGRRNRLKGGRPISRERKVTPNQSQLALPVQKEVELDLADEEEEGETLAQRMKRMKTKDALDGTIAHVVPQDGERPLSTFSEDVLGQLGDAGAKDKSQEASPNPQTQLGASPQPEEEETLGQRRARLQREREAGGEQRNISDGSNAARPPMLRSQTSLANILSANPIGQRAAGKNYQPAQGSLLHATTQMEARHKNALTNTNLRSSSYHLEKPLIDARTVSGDRVNPGGLLSQEQLHRAQATGFGAGMYNNGMGGYQLQQQNASTPMLQHSATMPAFGMNGYFPPPTAMTPSYGNMMTGGYGYPQQMAYPPQHMYQQQSMMNMNMDQLAYSTLNGNSSQQPMMSPGYGGNQYIPQTMGGGTYASYAQNMQLPAGMGGEQDVSGSGNGNQRSAIERWRLSVAPQ